ncbi:MAG: pyridoxamine 5-phosphate oxidase [Frankiales bacterium]|nr:pyridoxamine 5-phosphate oxidase [Frankiales bacterium]
MDSRRAVGWAAFETSAPELAAAVRERFTVRRHCTVATIRKDGSPRISGTEVEFSAGELWTGSMPGAVKALDLQRDPRVAVHSPTVDPPEGDEMGWLGEAKLAGVVEEQPPGQDGAHRFRVLLCEVVMTALQDGQLLITSWHPGRGLEQVRR